MLDGFKFHRFGGKKQFFSITESQHVGIHDGGMKLGIRVSMKFSIFPGISTAGALRRWR